MRRDKDSTLARAALAANEAVEQTALQARSSSKKNIFTAHYIDKIRFRLVLHLLRFRLRLFDIQSVFLRFRFSI